MNTEPVPIPVTQDDWGRDQYAAAAENLADPIKALALSASQLDGTLWGDEIERIRGRLALIAFEVQADIAEHDRQARPVARPAHATPLEEVHDDD